MHFTTAIQNIQPLDQAAMQAARARQNQLTKPPGSLGRLEQLSIQLAGMQRTPLPVIREKVVILMAGDHGVTAEGVSAYPQAVTLQMVQNFLGGGAAVNVLARHIGARVVVVDMGMVGDLPAPHEKLLRRKVAAGTANLAQAPAMQPAQAQQSLQYGFEVALEQISSGADILGTGDMGIGNTTPSAAIACALMQLPPEKIAGRGTGVDDAGLSRKISAIENGLKVNSPNPQDGLDVLGKVGGFEIGGLAGVMLGAASRQVPVMVDGFISTAAAMIAVTLAPAARDYLIFAHRSMETGHTLMLDWLNARPLLDLDLRLGEGTGAALGISFAEAACKILGEMATFGEAGVSAQA